MHTASSNRKETGLLPYVHVSHNVFVPSTVISKPTSHTRRPPSLSRNCASIETPSNDFPSISTQVHTATLPLIYKAKATRAANASNPARLPPILATSLAWAGPVGVDPVRDRVAEELVPEPEGFVGTGPPVAIVLEYGRVVLTFLKPWHISRTQ